MLVSSVLFITGCENMQRLPMGSKEESEKTFRTPNNEFESMQVDAAFRYIDSVFRHKKNKTVHDYVQYWGAAAYVAGIKGNLYKDITYLDSSIHMLEKYMTTPGVPEELSNIYRNKGDIEFSMHNYEGSYNDFFRAQRLSEKGADPCNKLNIPYSIGMILYRQQQYANANRYFQQCLPYTDTCKQLQAYKNNKKQEVLDNIGLCYTKTGQYDSALIFYQAAMNIVDANRFNLAVDRHNSMTRYAAAKGVICGNMAKVFLAKGMTDSAISLYRQAINYNATQGGELHDMQLCMVQLAQIYLDKEQLPELQQVLSDLGKAQGKNPFPDVAVNYHELLYHYYDATKQAGPALHYLSWYIKEKDSVTAQQKKMLETDIDKEIHDRRQEFEITLLQKDNQIKRDYLWGFIALSGMALLILFLIIRQYRISRKNIQQLTQLNDSISLQKKELEVALQQLERTNKEKDRILQVVAHDLRNPIGGIQSLSQILQQSGMVSPEGAVYVQTIANASSSATRLIQELLEADHSFIQDTEKKETNLAELLMGIRSLNNSAASNKQQSLLIELPAEPVIVYTYPVQLERVLNNLVGNAIKFSPEGASTHIRLIRGENEITIEVQDEGIGIAEEDLKHIFDRFTSIKRKGTAGEKSFGLGLSICRQIIEAMGGRIDARSQLGKGSRFTIILPDTRA